MQLWQTPFVQSTLFIWEGRDLIQGRGYEPVPELGVLGPTVGLCGSIVNGVLSVSSLSQWPTVIWLCLYYFTNTVSEYGTK